MQRKSLAILVLNLATVALAPAEQALRFDRYTPTVAVYAKTHRAVVNISGQRTVTPRQWPQSNWPPSFDWSNRREKSKRSSDRASSTGGFDLRWNTVIWRRAGFCFDSISIRRPPETC